MAVEKAASMADSMVANSVESMAVRRVYVKDGCWAAWRVGRWVVCLGHSTAASKVSSKAAWWAVQKDALMAAHSAEMTAGLTASTRVGSKA
jgi:hypothetical protein